jgi:hypothetical protein
MKVRNLLQNILVSDWLAKVSKKSSAAVSLGCQNRVQKNENQYFCAPRRAGEFLNDAIRIIVSPSSF